MKTMIGWTQPTGVVIAALSMLLTGCQSPQTSAAHKIADALPRALGPAKHYDVQVEGDTMALTRGHAARIHVVGQSVTVAPDTTLDTLDLDARGITFDPQTRRLTHVDAATFTACVGEQNLARYVRAHRVGLPRMSVRLRESDAEAVLPIRVPGLHTEATVSGTFAPDPEEPNHLDFVADAAGVGAVPIPARLVNGALQLVNPVFDLSVTKVPMTVTQVSIVQGKIVLSGTADLEDFQAS